MNKLLFWCITSTQVVFPQSWDYFLCLTKQTVCTSTIFELLDESWPDIQLLFYVLSYNPCSIVWRRLLFRSIIYVMCMGHLSHDDHVSQSHFSFSQGLVQCPCGCVLLVICLSLGYLLCRRVTFVTSRDREYRWLFFGFQKFWFWLENAKYGLRYYDVTIHNWRLWWLPSSVVCGILFKDINSCSVI